MKKEQIRRLFYPKSVAVIGATDNSKKMGYHAFKSLLNDYSGKIYPVNPNRKEVLGLRAYSIDDIPEAPELAILAIPRDHIYESVEKLIAKGTRAFVIITAGFREAEISDGEELHRKLKDLVDRENAVVIGPNTFGMVNVDGKLNASFSPFLSKVKRGGIALVSQSGGVCHLLVPYALREGIGFSKIVGLGNRLNIDFHDILEYLEEDEETKSIALYIEGIENPRKLCSAISRIHRKKPVVAMKSGRFEKANKASKSHTGSIAGNYKIYVSALRQHGAVIADDLVELISCAKALAMQKPLLGSRIAVISLVAGLGMVSADQVEISGLKLSVFTEETKNRLFRILPPYTIRENPVDLGFIANDRELCGEVIRIVAEDKNVDGIVVNYIYSWSEDFLEVPAKEIAEAGGKKPVTVCLNYPPGYWDDIKDFLEKRGIPVYPTPELAVKSLSALREYGKMLSKE